MISKLCFKSHHMTLFVNSLITDIFKTLWYQYSARGKADVESGKQKLEHLSSSWPDRKCSTRLSRIIRYKFEIHENKYEKKIRNEWKMTTSLFFFTEQKKKHKQGFCFHVFFMCSLFIFDTFLTSFENRIKSKIILH